MPTRIAVAAAVVLLIVPPAEARPVGNACTRSDHGSGNSALCRCIQQVADKTLSYSDQRRAAKLFNDPHQAQVVRSSGSSSDSAFWARYTKFAAVAEAYCS